MAISKDIVKNYVDSALKSEVLEDSFMPFTLKRDGIDNKTNGTSCPGTKRILLTMSTSSEPDKIIQHYVNLMAPVKSTAKFDGLFEVLRLLVQQHPNLGKAVCEALLSCDRLDYYNRNSWMRSFELIQEILPNVDYKGVRDILKYVLEIIYSLPEKFDISIIPQLDMLYNTFSMILDREACLLPAYLGLDELQKRITQGSAPVWKFAELFYHFIESFRQTAQIFSIINRPDLLPIVGYSLIQSNTSWRLDPISAKFQLKGLLPYRDKLKEPQVGQVRYLLEQSYSRDMMSITLSLGSKASQQRCAELIEQMAVSLVAIMDRSEETLEAYGNLCASTSEHLYQWTHLSNNMLYYIIHNQATVSFNQLVDSLCEKIKVRNHKRGSEHLMWALLQYITGFPKQALSDFLSVTKLFDILYSSRRPLKVLPEDSPYLPYSMAATSIWLQLVRRAEMDQIKILKPLPPSLQLHYEYLTNMKPPTEPLMNVGFKEVVYLNAHTLNKSGYPVNNFIDSICKVDQNYNPKQASPIPVRLLDALTTHSKVSLLHTLVQRIITIAQNKNQPQAAFIVTPALIETYGRLLVYPDSESFGIKAFIGHLMGGPQAVWRYQAWDVYHVLLEMYSYRLHHLAAQFKYQMLVSMHSLSPMVYGANQIQLSMTLETAELKLLLGLSNQEALNIPINPRHTNDLKAAKQMINSDSEELNKALVLVLARALHLTSSDHIASGVMIEDILADIHKVTPLSWSSSTLSFFPTLIKDFFTRNAQTKADDKAQLRLTVEEEYKKWQAMANDETRIAHFSQPSAPPLFICVVWRMLIDQDSINPIVFRILDTFRIRTLSTNIKTFVDYLVHEFSTSGAANISKNSDALNRLLCKYRIINLERLLLCMCLRSYDGCEAQVCYFIIQLILLRSDFKQAVIEFCKMMPSHEHWRQDISCQDLNAKFLSQNPEKYYHDYMLENNIRSNGATLPSFFSNVCLRALPVFDIIIHRALELRILSPNSAMKIDQILDNFGNLYRFHDKPLTYLYNTLYYYDSQLPSALKKKLTMSIIGAFKDVRPPNWCLTESLMQHLQKSLAPGNQQNEEWVPGPNYYRSVIGRLVDTIQNKNAFYHTDWRFSEFPNVKAHAVHATAIEFMTLPVAPTVVGNAILDLVLTSYINQERSTISQWMNAIGLVMTALPASYYSVLNTKILEYMKSPLLTNPAYTRDILHLMNFSDSHDWMYESQISYLVALTHSIWHHSSIGMIHNLQTFWRMEVKHAVETESQFLFVCCLIGPFLSRLERSRLMMDVVVELYEMLGKVDSTSEIQHLNTISDFFYHIKYMFTGDAVKNDIERCIRNFKPRLQYCLRFITHLNISNELLMKHD
uniref:Mediator of RNA polymerase II transcription subunit 23 n=1 Tax=Aceria tosichella TaxID=561515 RepID=A0A6G1S8A1_9ACAR